MKAVVLGLGNILLTDEGIGVHAVTALERQYHLPPEVTVIDGGTSGMDCLDQIAGLDLLLIADCVRAGTPAGTLTRLEGDDLAAFFRTRISPHQVGLCEVLATLRVHDLSPGRLVLIGAEPDSLALGLEPSPTLAAALPGMVAALVAELAAAGLVPMARAA